MWSGPILNPTLAIPERDFHTTLILCQRRGEFFAEPAVSLSTGLRFGVFNFLNQLKLSRLDVNCAQLTSALVKYRTADVGNVVKAYFAHG